MVTHTKRRVPQHELRDRAERLARGIPVAPKFSELLAWWAGYPIKRVPVEPDEPHVLDEHEAQLFALDPGTEVLRRNGVLVPLHADGPVLASVRSLVFPPRLGLTPAQTALLRAGATPVGLLIPHAPRSTHYVIRLDGPSEPAAAALASRATLYCGGLPAVLADELVLWRVLRDRAPQRGAVFHRPLPTSVPVW